MRDLIASIDADLPPFTNQVNNITYDLGVSYVYDISDLDGTIAISIDEVMRWTDSRLQFNENVVINSTKIWVPKTSFANLFQHDVIQE